MRVHSNSCYFKTALSCEYNKFNPHTCIFQPKIAVNSNRKLQVIPIENCSLPYCFLVVFLSSVLLTAPCYKASFLNK